MSNEHVSKKDVLVNRIYPSIKSCVANRYKIVMGIFAVYGFLSTNLNTIIQDADVKIFSAWIFTFFIFHNTLNYLFNVWEQYDIEQSSNDPISCCKRIFYFIRTEGLYSFSMLLIVWIGYYRLLK